MLAAGALFRNTSVANLVSSMMLLFVLLFCGFLLNRGSNGGDGPEGTEPVLSWWQVLQYMSYFSWGFDALLINEFQGQAFSISAPNFDGVWRGTGVDVLKKLGMTPFCQNLTMSFYTNDTTMKDWCSSFGG